MLKMTGLDSFLSIWSDYLSCFVSLVVVFAYLVILWISCYPLNILSCFEYALVTCIFPLVRSGRPSASLAPASSCSSSTMASSSIVSICSSAITHSFAGSSNVLSIHTNSNTSTHSNTNTHTHTYIHSHTASLHEGEGEILILHLHSLAHDIAQHEGEGETRIHLFNLQLRLYVNIQ